MYIAWIFLPILMGVTTVSTLFFYKGMMTLFFSKNSKNKWQWKVIHEDNFRNTQRTEMSDKPAWQGFWIGGIISLLTCPSSLCLMHWMITN